MDEEKRDALLLCGKRTGGADYAVFQALCESFARMEGHPARLRAEEQLRRLFGCNLPPIPENGETIWALTADRLLLSPVERAAAVEIAAPGQPDGRVPTLPPQTGSLSDYPELPDMDATDFAAWEKQAEAWLERNSSIKGISLRLPKTFHAVRPSRYGADRHLSGVAPNEDLWISQTDRFLLYALQKREQKLLLITR